VAHDLVQHLLVQHVGNLVIESHPIRDPDSRPHGERAFSCVLVRDGTSERTTAHRLDADAQAPDECCVGLVLISPAERVRPAQVHVADMFAPIPGHLPDGFEKRRDSMSPTGARSRRSPPPRPPRPGDESLDLSVGDHCTVPQVSRGAPS